MLVVSVISLKGGVGKTSVVLGLAGAAVARGMSVVVVDMDPQGNATSVLGARRSRATLADAMGNPDEATVTAALT